MSSHVAIPIINQTVQTPSPDLAPNPLRAEPIESSVGPALAAGGQAAMNIAIRQRQQQNAIDAADAGNKFDAQIGDLKNRILNSGMSADDMATNFKTGTGDLINTWTSSDSSPYPHIARQLAVSLRNQVAPHLETFPSQALARVSHDLDFKFNQQTSAAAASIGQNYVIGGTADAPTFTLNADGSDALKRQAAAIDAAYPPQSRGTENQFYRDMLAKKSALQTGMAVAQDHPSLIDSYLQQHAAVLDQQQQDSLRNQATAAIARPMREINANNDATRAQLIQKFNGQVLNPAQNGPLDVAALEHAARFRLITPEDYEHYAGIPLAQPSDPDAVQAAQSAIASARSPEELDDLRASIAGNQLIRGKDSVMLPIQIENAKRQMATPAGRALIAGEETIREAFDPKTPAEALNQKIADKIAPGVRANALRKALANFRVSTFKETDPAKINAAALSASPPPASSRPAASAPPPAVTDDVAKKAAALARERGLIH